MTLEQSSAAASRDRISGWLIDWISKELEMPAEEIDTGHSLLQYSMSSVTATILVGDLEDWLDLRLSPTLVWDYSSIDAMTEYLVDEKARQKSTGGADQPSTGPADAREMLDNLDQLSDEEVDALLAQLSSGQAAT